MPAEVRQRIIGHLLPNIVDEAMQICPCLAKAPRRAQKSCSCFENGLSWDYPYQRPPSNIAVLYRPMLLVNRMFHHDTIHVLSKLPETIHFCSGPCLLVFLRCTPFKHRKTINWALLKFNILQFGRFQYSTVRFKQSVWVNQYDLEEGFAKQIGYMMRARTLWGLSDPSWVAAACFKYFKEDDEDLQRYTVGLSLDLTKDARVLHEDPSLSTYWDLDFKMGFRHWKSLFEECWRHGE